MSDRWIRLYPKLIESRVFLDEGVLKVWVWCLLKANWKPTYWMDEQLAPGQFVFGINSASQELNMTPSRVRRALKKLEDWGNISRKSTNRFSVVSVNNWSTYQNPEEHERQTNDKQTTNKRQTNDKQTTTALEGIETKEINTLSQVEIPKTEESKEERAPENFENSDKHWRHPLPPRMAKNEQLNAAWNRWCDYSYQLTGRKLEPAYAEGEIKRMCDGARLHKSVDPVIEVIDRSIAKRSKFLFLDDLFAGPGAAGGIPARNTATPAQRDLATENNW